LSLFGKLKAKVDLKYSWVAMRLGACLPNSFADLLLQLYLLPCSNLAHAVIDAYNVVRLPTEALALAAPAFTFEALSALAHADGLGLKSVSQHLN
jgi:hypothetical protein